MADYQYPPVFLPFPKTGQWMRLLNILPGSLGAELRLTLHAANLSESPQYEALSYTWGTSTGRREVTVNTAYALPVTDNLYRALQRLRRKRTGRTIWIDALCINQLDIDERANQVSIMDQVYNNAACVLIWLGEPAQALRMQPEPAGLISTALKIRGSSRIGLWESVTGRLRSFALAIAVARKEHQALESALQETSPHWHERAWTIQELMLARKLRCLFGAFDWSVDRLRMLGNLLDNPKIKARRNGEPFRIHLQDIRERLVRREIHKMDLHFDALELCQAVGMIYNTAAADPRDLIYSIRGIISRHEARYIGVDYTLPFSSVCARATYASIRSRGHHDILLSVDKFDDDTRTGLPSWAVDFSNGAALKKSHSARAGTIAIDEVKVSGYAPETKNTRYALTSYGPAELDPTFTRLTILGTAGATVAEVRSLSLYWDTHQLRAWATASTSRHFGQDPSAASSRLLHQALEPRHSRQLDRMLAEWNQQLYELVGMDDSQTPGLHLDRDAIYDLLRHWDDLVESRQDAWRETRGTEAKWEDDHCSGISPTLGGVSLFVLSNGLIGFAPDSIAREDLIVIASSSSDHGDGWCSHASPFLILRPRTDGSHTFRGLAYVHGCMHSHFWQDWQRFDWSGSVERFTMV